MSPESENDAPLNETAPGSGNDAPLDETAPDSEAPRSESAEAPTADASTQGASEAEAVPPASAASPAPTEEPESEDEDEEPEAEDEDEEPEPEGQAPADARKRRRRPGRRRGKPEAAEPAKPAKPTPSRRRSRRDPNAPAPVVRAQAKYVRSSARKARLVCDHIRGKSVEEARAILAVTPRAIAREWSKLLESAVANAEHNHELVGEDLYVKAVHADEGPTIKRFRPRAMGRATRIRKRTSHLTIMLTPKD